MCLSVSSVKIDSSALNFSSFKRIPFDSNKQTTQAQKPTSTISCLISDHFKKLKCVKNDSCSDYIIGLKCVNVEVLEFSPPTSEAVDSNIGPGA